MHYLDTYYFNNFGINKTLCCLFASYSFRFAHEWGGGVMHIRRFQGSSKIAIRRPNHVITRFHDVY